jgi:hypothetical protein
MMPVCLFACLTDSNSWSQYIRSCIHSNQRRSFSAVTDCDDGDEGHSSQQEELIAYTN